MGMGWDETVSDRLPSPCELKSRNDKIGHYEYKLMNINGLIVVEFGPPVTRERLHPLGNNWFDIFRE